jgi:hypothetical protein
VRNTTHGEYDEWRERDLMMVVVQDTCIYTQAELVDITKGLFSFWKFLENATVANSLLFDKYYSIMD